VIEFDYGVLMIINLLLPVEP